jgi:hypothetical protein
MSKIDHREKSLLTVNQYARKKKVSRQAVEYRIRKGDIIPVYVGMLKDEYIDWSTYRDLDFNKNMKR